jgi:hypothetical protein
MPGCHYLEWSPGFFNYENSFAKICFKINHILINILFIYMFSS